MKWIVEKKKRKNKSIECEGCTFEYCFMSTDVDASDEDCPCKQCIVKVNCSQSCDGRKKWFGKP